MLFFTKYTECFGTPPGQDARSKQGDQSMIENLHVVKRLGHESKTLEAGLAFLCRDHAFIGA